MFRRNLTALFGIAVFVAVSGMPARANPPVTAIMVGGIPLLIWSMFEDTPRTREEDQISANFGYFDALARDRPAGTFGFEYRSNFLVWKFHPTLGAVVTTHGQGYIYAGLRLDAFFGKRIVVSPSVTPAFYHKGDGKDLGSSGVLRSGIDLSYRFDDKSQLGVGFHHMSHGKVFGNLNPGTETFQLFYSVPLSALLGK